MQNRTEAQGSRRDCNQTLEGCDKETRCLVPIRVLYTINASPQFLLARHRRRVQVLPITWHEESIEPASVSLPTHSIIGLQKFAKVPLKTCLGAVCSCSPELLADRSRDYSVYVLDPLESTSTTGNYMGSQSDSPPADSHISDGATSPGALRKGVSTGMGLMSWCLSNDFSAVIGVNDDDDDDGCVIGRLVKDRGVDALEVVLFLRETTPQSQQQHALSLSALGVYPSSTTLPLDHPSQGSTQPSSSVSSSPKCHIPSTQPEASQISIDSTDPSAECTLACDEPSIPQAASSATFGHARRVGRPPGTTTNPEKRARRLAIQSHKEMLERMESIAKMQRGEKYDKSLIRISDHDRPPVTNEEIARQRKILEELESRPLIVDKSRLLTTKPLPKRARVSTSAVPLSKSTPPKRTPKSSSFNTATASGSGVRSVDVTCEDNASTNIVAKSNHGSQDLLSLLTSVLGKVDGCSTTQPNDPGSQKGKDKETADDTLAGVLRELLPLIPNVAAQTSTLSFQDATPSPISTTPTSIIPRGSQTDQWNGSQRTLLSNTSRLFKTADETFHHSQPGPYRPNGQHWAINVPRSMGEYPKVHEDAHPVPGGGWARGKNLVPRAATSDSMLPPSERGEPVVSNATKRDSPSSVETQPDKENTPPKKTGRGIKRALPAVVEAKEKGNAPLKPNEKKRKQSPEQAHDGQDAGSAKRAAMGLKPRNKTNTFGASNLTVTASSPCRRAASASTAPNLPVMAISEPDYILPPPPIVATTTSPDLIIEPPRTPPRHETPLDDNGGDSLFTPCALDLEFTSRFRGGTHHSDNGPPSSPSASRRKPRGCHVANQSSVATLSEGSPECSGTTSDSQLVRTGWDLPPSSPPPPTSPISPYADIDSQQNDTMIFELTMQPQIGSAEVEKNDTVGKFGDWGPTTKCDGDSTTVGDVPPSLFQTSDCSSDFDSLTDPDFDFGWLSQCQESTEGNELDVEELWSSLGPVISQAQSDSSVTTNNQTSSQVEADFSCFDLGSDLSHVDTEDVQGGVDAAKLADDLKALFGGCVV